MSHKQMRLPNGFGEITKITAKPLRHPFRVRTVIGKKPTGRPEYKTLGYYTTYNEAYAALTEFHQNPYNLDAKISMQELYERWSVPYFEKISRSSVRTVTAAWRYCSAIADTPVQNIRTGHLKAVVESCPNANTGARVKSVFNLMFDYACEFDLVKRNYARDFNVERPKEPDKEHIIYTDDEMRILWRHAEDRTVRLILIQCYTGWRPQEIGLIKREDVDIMDWTMKGGMKTAAGKDRVVPIHPKIRKFVEDFIRESYELSSEYAFCWPDGSKMTYDKFRHAFNRVKKSLELNPDHRGHDGRKHFITKCKEYKVDDFAIKYMVGHVIDDLTERVYTERSNDWLAKELYKLH